MPWITKQPGVDYPEATGIREQDGIDQVFIPDGAGRVEPQVIGTLSQASTNVHHGEYRPAITVAVEMSYHRNTADVSVAPIGTKILALYIQNEMDRTYLARIPVDEISTLESHISGAKTALGI